MKIPNKMKIGAHIYDVIFDKDRFEGETCGIQSRKDSSIVINSTLPQSHMEATFFHELLHAINSELDHTLLESLSEQIYQVLSENNLLK